MTKHGISFTLGSLFTLFVAIIFLNLGLFASGTDLIEDGQHTTLNFVNIAHAQSDEQMVSETYPSPAKQLKDGVGMHDIQCNDSRELYIRQSQTPVCLYDETYDLMQSRGIELVPATPSSSTGIFTSEEAQWLADNPVIRVSFDPRWTPIEYADESGNLQGVTLDYIAEFEAISGADLVPVPAAETWADALMAVEERNAEIMYMVAPTPERLEYMSFTSPHYTIKTSMISLNDTLLNIDDEGLTLITINGYEIESWLDENHPDTEYIPVDSPAEAYALLAAGGADAFTSVWPVAVHHAKMSGIDNVYNVGTTGHQYDLTVGYRNDLPLLGSIMQKVLDQIPQEKIDSWYGASASAGEIFTTEEAQWLADNPVIRVSFDPGWTPIEYADESGNLQGVTLDYIAEFEAISGADLVPVPAAETWADALMAVEERNAEIMYMVAPTPERLEYMSFTSPHYTIKTSMISLNDTLLNIDDEGLTLITINGYEIESWLDENHPDTEYIPVDSPAEAYALLAAGGADAFTSVWPVAAHHAKMSGIDNVYNVGTTGHQYDLTVGYRNDLPLLGSIMQKTLDNIPQERIDSWYDAVAQTTDDAETLESVVIGVIDDAIALYDSDPANAFEQITSMELTNPQYPFAMDYLTTRIVAHGAFPERVGEIAVALTESNIPLDVILSDLEKGNVWAEYVFANPSTGIEQTKRSLYVLHDGYIFSSGYYTTS